MKYKEQKRLIGEKNESDQFVARRQGSGDNFQRNTLNSIFLPLQYFLFSNNIFVLFLQVEILRVIIHWRGISWFFHLNHKINWLKIGLNDKNTLKPPLLPFLKLVWYFWVQKSRPDQYFWCSYSFCSRGFVYFVGIHLPSGFRKKMSIFFLKPTMSQQEVQSSPHGVVTQSNGIKINGKWLLSCSEYNL